MTPGMNKSNHPMLLIRGEGTTRTISSGFFNYLHVKGAIICYLYGVESIKPFGICGLLQLFRRCVYCHERHFCFACTLPIALNTLLHLGLKEVASNRGSIEVPDLKQWLAYLGRWISIVHDHRQLLL